MKITSKILSIPPYLSTTWKNISSLHAEEEGGGYKLIALLQNRTRVEVPGLTKEAVAEIFEAHARAAEAENSLPQSPYSFSLPLKSDGSLELLSSSLQHNPDQADLPPLPPDVLKKITGVARAFGLEDLSVLPQPESNCNCMYCQIIRFLGGEKEEVSEEVVSDEDLRFRNWDIAQLAEKLYLVSNPLDKNEHYNVFLGEPLGCTCGQKNCEHIRAVLNT